MCIIEMATSKVYTNNKKKDTLWVSFFLLMQRDSKGRPDRREGKQVSSGHLFSPWENP